MNAHIAAQSCLTATPWAVAYKPPLFTGFSGKNLGVGSHFRLQLSPFKLT